ncbi:unnamed protein product [Lepeophtheirus salmonis]|uniref:(salmon louse) hypothetical protein n=1 Tax=Lepeophtheirus salmonis TaxID=72036 RepID=A0A7R8CEI6_LEPSM|nr:unnamed protein product [Lepeophtheirus salmonis]CAF2791465.1 unnamed protein product [Lepeophtheirus salmonis]
MLSNLWLIVGKSYDSTKKFAYFFNEDTHEVYGRKITLALTYESLILLERKMDDEGGIGDCFTLSGFLKIMSSACIFICLMLHRIGNRGNQIFFGANDMELNYNDVIFKEADAEILGQGTTMAYTIITPMLLIAYVVEGRRMVQSSSLDGLLTLVGAVLLIASGGIACFNWNSNSNMNNMNIGRRDYEAAGSLGVMTILNRDFIPCRLFQCCISKSKISK